MPYIVKSSLDILPWNEVEKQKLIEEKKEFLNNKSEVKKDENKQLDEQKEKKEVKEIKESKQEKPTQKPT